MCGGRGVWGVSAPLPYFGCELKTAVKDSLNFKKTVHTLIITKLLSILTNRIPILHGVAMCSSLTSVQNDRATQVLSNER